ncbi:MAG: type II secretion system F family protein [Chloroflexi bacterium]|nr:type II secretion system F family protein [Chloroflexota bacterium]
MNGLTLVVAGIAAVAIILIAIGVASSGSTAGVTARLERYASGRPDKGKAKPEGLAELIAQSTALATLNKAVEERDFGANLARELARADLKLKVSEYLVIWAATTVGTPVVFFVLGFVVTSLQSPIALLGGVILGFFAPRIWLNRRRSGRLNAFNKQLPDTITLVANALRAGSSFLQAIELVVRESRPPISTEFSRVIREVNLGLPFDAAMENMVRRMKSEDFELMATAINIQHSVGGNLAEILDSIAYTIRERVRIKGEIRTLTAQQRLSGYVVAGLPFGLAAFIYLAAPTFFDPMFDAKVAVGGLPAGIIILGVGLLMMMIGFFAIQKIVDIEV